MTTVIESTRNPQVTMPCFCAHNICMPKEKNEVSGLRQQIERTSLNLALCLASAVEKAGEPEMYRHLDRVQVIVAELEFLMGCLKPIVPVSEEEYDRLPAMVSLRKN